MSKKDKLEKELKATLNSSASKTKKKDDFQPAAVRQKIIRINPMALVSLFMQNNQVGVKKGILAGTRYVGGGYDAATNCFFLHVEHDHFPEVEVGDRLENVEMDLVDLNLKNLDGTFKDKE